MKRAFIIANGYGLISAMVSEETPSALSIGNRITATRALDLGYAALIEEGEQGTVDFIDPITGLVEVLMDVVHRGLHLWDNHIWLEPFGTEDILSGIACYASVSRIAA